MEIVLISNFKVKFGNTPFNVTGFRTQPTVMLFNL